MVADPGDTDELQQISDGALQPVISKYLDAQKIAKVGHVNNCFLENGSRFYHDVRDRREYATPEDDSFIGTTANEIVNDEIMKGIARTFEELYEKPISFTKRVIDDSFVSCGYHVNYSGNAEKVKINNEDLALFGVYAATRAVLFGAGALLPGGHYVTAQKAMTLDTDFSTSTVEKKPVVNLRTTPHADPKRFIRLHDTSSDPNMSPWATRMKLGVGSLVLRLIENEKTLPNLRLKDPLFQVANAVALDTKLSEPLQLKNGRTMSALQIQKHIMLHAKLLSNQISLKEEEQWTLDEWERAIHDLEKDPLMAADRVEWVMRKRILSRIQDRHGWSWDSQQLRYKDRQFSEVTDLGMATALRETIWADFMPSESLIRERVKEAPRTTRASIRAAFIKEAQSFRDKSLVRVGWSEVRYGDSRLALPDPHMHYNEDPDLLAS